MSGREERKPEVLVVGGGIAGLEAVLTMRALCGGKVDITLLSPSTTYTFKPVAVAEPFGLAERIKINLNAFGQSQDTNFQSEELERVDTAKRHVWSSNGVGRSYDYLLIATGARREASVDGAIQFVGFAGVREFENLLHEISRGVVKRVAFTAGAGVGWYLPMYELALMTAEFARQRELPLQMTVVTPEAAPLAAFGAQNSAEVTRILEESGIVIVTGEYPTGFENGQLHLVPKTVVKADTVVALPTLKGPTIGGLPADEDGFIPVDASCRIEGCAREFAAGDATNFPVKQGGIAAQMAGAAAKAIAVDLGLLVDARAFRPTLDGTLLTGRSAHHLHQTLTMGLAENRLHHVRGTWLPIWKVAAPFLTDYLGDYGLVDAAKAQIDAEHVAADLAQDRDRHVVGN